MAQTTVTVAKQESGAVEGENELDDLHQPPLGSIGDEITADSLHVQGKSELLLGIRLITDFLV